MNIYRPYYELGPGKEGGADYCLQDKIIYGWSDSNVQYEPVWWLNADGWPVSGSEHVRNILRDRPFDREWLKEPRLKPGMTAEKIAEIERVVERFKNG